MLCLPHGNKAICRKQNRRGHQRVACATHSNILSTYCSSRLLGGRGDARRRYRIYGRISGMQVSANQTVASFSGGCGDHSHHSALLNLTSTANQHATSIWASREAANRVAEVAGEVLFYNVQLFRTESSQARFVSAYESSLGVK